MNLSVALKALMGVILLVTVAESAKRTRYLLNKPECSEKNFKKVEMIIAKAAALGPHGRKFPEDLTQLKGFCRDTTRYINQVEQFAKSCFEKEIRDFASIILYTIKSNVRKFCSSSKKSRKIARDMLKFAPCANKHVQPNDQCLQQFMDKTKQLVHVTNDKLKMPFSCCYFVDMVRCSEDFLNSISCMRSHVPTLLEYYRTNAASLTEMTCGDYNDQTDACTRLGAPPKPAIENRKKYLTPFSLAFDMLDRMQNFTAPIPS